MTQAIFSAEPKAPATGQFFPPKVFSRPFRLAFKREDGETIWTEIRSLEGLQGVFKKLGAGDLTEIDRSSSMEMQLWGHLAEHTGFLRVQGSTSMLAAGIQPAGAGLAPLTEDLSELMGSDDISALNMLDRMKRSLKTRAEDRAPVECPEVTNEFVKPDGVNLTEDGENVLQNLVFGDDSVPKRNPKAAADAISFRKSSENAIEIFNSTPNARPEEQEVEAKEAIDCAIRGDKGSNLASFERNALPLEGEAKTGPGAVLAGRMVAAVGRGLDNEQDEALKAFTKKAIKIFNTEIPKTEETKTALDEFRASIRKIFPALKDILDVNLTAEIVAEALDKAANKVPGLDIDFEELKHLAGIKPIGNGPIGPTGLPSRIKPTEVAGRDNIDKILKTVDLEELVSQSDLPTMTTKEQKEHQERAERIREAALRTDRTFYPEGENPHQKALDDLKARAEGTYYEAGISREEAISRGFKTVEEPDQTYGSDHYKGRQVTPASEVPTDQDERAKWLAEQQQRGPASMDTYREDTQRTQFLVDGRPVHNDTKDAKQDKEDYETKMSSFTDVPVDMDEIRRLAGLDKPKSNDEDSED